MVLAETLSHAAAAKGMSARELARRLEVEASTVSRWFRGDTIPGEDQLEPIAAELALDHDALVDQLVTEREERSKRSRYDELAERVARLEMMVAAIAEEAAKPVRKRS